MTSCNDQCIIALFILFFFLHSSARTLRMRPVFCVSGSKMDRDILLMDRHSLMLPIMDFTLIQWRKLQKLLHCSILRYSESVPCANATFDVSPSHGSSSLLLFELLLLLLFHQTSSCGCHSNAIRELWIEDVQAIRRWKFDFHINVAYEFRC